MKKKIEQVLVAIIFVVCMFFAFTQSAYSQQRVEYYPNGGFTIKVFDTIIGDYGEFTVFLYENQLGQNDLVAFYRNNALEGQFITYACEYNDKHRFLQVLRVLEIEPDEVNSFTLGDLNFHTINQGAIVSFDLSDGDRYIDIVFYNTDKDEYMTANCEVISIEHLD